MMTLYGNKGPIERLTKERQLIGYRHERFWSCMDTLKEKAYLGGSMAVRQGSMEDMVGKSDFGFSGDRWWRHWAQYRPWIET